MRFELIPAGIWELPKFKKDMQNAFQKSFESSFGKTDDIILPEKDIEQSLHTAGAAAYKAVADGVTAGGAVVIIDGKTKRNHLDLLFVKNEFQGKGIGKKIP